MDNKPRVGMTRRHIAEMLKMLEAQGLKTGCAMRADHVSRPRVPALKPTTPWWWTYARACARMQDGEVVSSISRPWRVPHVIFYHC